MTPEQKARHRERGRKWRTANPEQAREQTREAGRRWRATPEGRLRWNLKSRKAAAKRAGIPWSITLADVAPEGAPRVCPVLGLAFDYGGKAADASPTIDRIIPGRGYVPGNVALICMRANTIKQDHDLATLEARLAALEPGDATAKGVEDWELEQVVRYVRRHTEEQ